MKKILLVLASAMMLAGCSGNNSNSGKNTVSLSLDNYGDYVATRIHTLVTGSTSSDDLYVDAYFEGSNLVSFKDCVVTCHYLLTGTERVSGDYTVKLTISGDGCIPSYMFRNHPEYVPEVVVTAVSGTVTYIY